MAIALVGRGKPPHCGSHVRVSCSKPREASTTSDDFPAVLFLFLSLSQQIRQ